MDRKAAILADPETKGPAKLEVTIRESASAPTRLKIGLAVQAKVEGKVVRAHVAPEWRVEMN